MSAIAFLLGFDGRPATEAELMRLSALQPRPPRSGVRAVIRGPLAALAHVPAPGLPVAPGLTLCADVRLDDRDELARRLGLAAEASRLDDADLVLCAYTQGGIDALARLTGDYALVLHDATLARAVIAGDLLSARPLAYATVGGRLVCASSARSLVRAGLVPAERDEEHILAALVPLLESSEATRTVHRHVARLAAGELRVWEHGRLVQARIGTLIEDASVRAGSLDEHTATLRDELRHSVAERMRGPGGVGATLSGGIDSSAVVGQARRLLVEAGGGPLATFSVLGDEPAACPETEAVLAVEAQGGLAPTHLHPRELQAWSAEVQALLERLDDPHDVLTGLVPVATMLLARARGLGALLTGVDGDLATSLGSDLPGYALAHGQPLRAWRYAAAGGRGRSRARLLWSEGLKRLPPRPLRRVWQTLARSEERRLAAWVVESGLSPDLIARLDLHERLRTTARRLWPDVGVWGAAPQRRHVARLNSGFLSVALGRYQRIAWAAGVEVRHPLASVRLLRSTVRAPYWAKDAGGVTKGLLRRAGAGVLPETVLRRPAQGTNLNADLEAAFAACTGIREAFLADTERAGLRAHLGPSSAAAVGAASSLGLASPLSLCSCWAVARALATE